MVDGNIFGVLSKEDLDTIGEIAERAEVLEKHAMPERAPTPRSHVVMMLATVHAKQPLRLRALLEADPFNFAHDVFGLMRHFDVASGEVRNCFLPRFTRSDAMESEL